MVRPRARGSYGERVASTSLRFWKLVIPIYGSEATNEGKALCTIERLMVSIANGMTSPEKIASPWWSLRVRSDLSLTQQPSNATVIHAEQRCNGSSSTIQAE